MDKLPRHDLIVSELAHNRAMEQMRLNNWEEAGEAYLSLLRLARCIPDRHLHISMYIRAVAMLLEFRRTLAVADSSTQINSARLYVDQALARVDWCVLSDLRALVAHQGRDRIHPSSSQIAGLDDARDGHDKQSVYSPQALELSLSHRWAMARTCYRHGSTDTPNHGDGDDHESNGGQSDDGESNIAQIDYTESPTSFDRCWDDIFDTHIDKPSFPFSDFAESPVHPEMDSRDVLGWAPLHYAVLSGRIHDVESFFEAGASPNISNLRAWTPLHYASLHDHREISRALLDRMACVDAKDIDGVSPMYCAASENNVFILGFLMANGAIADFQDLNGKTPIHIAAQKGHSERSSSSWYMQIAIFGAPKGAHRFTMQLREEMLTLSTHFSSMACRLINWTRCCR